MPPNPKRKRKPTQLEEILAQPEYAAALERSRIEERESTIRILQKLHSHMDGRIMHRIRRQRPILKNQLRRDPVAVAYRYLRRFTKFEWHRGGSHVARHDFGPGIGFRNIVNNQARKLEVILIRIPIN